jgi:hypothetical protein
MNESDQRIRDALVDATEARALELGDRDLIIVVSDGRRQETAILGDLTQKMPKKK